MNTQQNTAALNTPEGKAWLISMLKMGPARITFTKTDGSERVMNCTLEETALPSIENKTDRIKKINEEVLPVFDLDKKQWRSFRLSQVTQVHFEL